MIGRTFWAIAPAFPTIGLAALLALALALTFPAVEYKTPEASRPPAERNYRTSLTR